MADLRLGPITVRRWLGEGAAIRRGPLTVVPVARVTEIGWRSGQLHAGWRLAEPDHLAVQTIAGNRRVRIRRPGGWLPMLLGLTVALTLALGWWPARREREEVSDGR